MPAEVAAARIEAFDAARAGFLKRHFGVRSDEPSLYDLVINMAHIDVATAVDLVCLAATRADATLKARDESLQPQSAEGCECR